MVESKEEVFSWFKKLSGAKRVEVLYGLLHLCIPLEWRYFASILENLGRRDYMMLKTDEIIANSLRDLEEVCDQSWLEVEPMATKPSLNSNASLANEHLKPNGISSSATSPLISPSGSRATSPSLSTVSSVERDSKSSIRSKIVIYLCLMNSTNRPCATTLFKAFRKQLSLENIKKHLDVVNQRNTATDREGKSSHHGSSGHLDQRPLNCIIVDQQFMAEIILLFTLAIHHSAFLFEQRTTLIKQLAKVRSYMEGLVSAASLTPVLSGPHAAFPLSVNVRPTTVSLAQLQQQVGALSPSIRVTSRLEAMNLNNSNSNLQTNPNARPINGRPSSPSPPASLDGCPDCAADCSVHSNRCCSNSITSVPPHVSQLSGVMPTIENNNAPLILPPPAVLNVSSSFIGDTTKSAISKDLPKAATEIPEILGRCPNCSCIISSTGSSNSVATTPASTPPALSPLSQTQRNHDSSHYPCWYLFPPGSNSMSVPADWVNHYYQQWPFGFNQGNNLPLWSHHLQYPVANGITNGGQYAFPHVSEAPPRVKTLSCFNCGENGHGGTECTKETYDDVTKSSDFNLDFSSPLSEVEPHMISSHTNGGSVVNVSHSTALPSRPRNNERPTRLTYDAGRNPAMNRSLGSRYHGQYRNPGTHANSNHLVRRRDGESSSDSLRSLAGNSRS
ncbi:hypothetical protein HDE_12090 [Halotydeus destructor]|nr:hypothetical protein HDE_12090 [Halotydeus destructor]